MARKRDKFGRFITGTPTKRRTRKNPSFKTGPRTSKAGQKKRRGVVQQQTTPSYVIKEAGKHKGVIKRNPVSSRNVRRAVNLYMDFHGDEPKFIDTWEITVPGAALQVGHVTGILYKTRMDGKLQEFMHEFTGKSRPILAASADGQQLLLLGGDYKFTERGIVDGTYSFTRGSR